MADLKLDTLIKVLLMTTSSQDGEALAAMRRANILLRNANTDWDKLLRGKVTVVADPFADIAAPDTKERFSSSKPTVPQKPQVPDPPTYTAYPKTATRPMGPAATPRAPSYSPQAARRNNTNSFAGHCYNCNDAVAAGYGALRDIMGKTHVFCEDCNFGVSNGRLSISDVINNNQARKLRQQQQASPYTPRVKRKVTTKDLMADIFDNKGPTPKSPKQIDDDIVF